MARVYQLKRALSWATRLPLVFVKRPKDELVMSVEAKLDQIRMIQGVEGVEPDLELHFLRNFEILSQRQIHVPEAGAANGAASEIAGTDWEARCGTDRHSQKCWCIQILQSLGVIRVDRISGKVIGAADVFSRLFGNDDRLSARG